jgi:serine/threonine protein kinase
MGLPPKLSALRCASTDDCRWHQDLKPENILVLSNMATSPYEYTFKMADFGLSHVQKPTRNGEAGTVVDAYGNATYGMPTDQD